MKDCVYVQHHSVMVRAKTAGLPLSTVLCVLSGRSDQPALPYTAETQREIKTKRSQSQF